MAFFIGAAQDGIESASAASNMNPRDTTRIVINPLFHLFDLSQASCPEALDRPGNLWAISQTFLGPGFLHTRYGRSRFEMDSSIEKKNLTKQPLWPSCAMRSCCPNTTAAA